MMFFGLPLLPVMYVNCGGKKLFESCICHHIVIKIL
jgi:hypothetical protein